MEVYNNYPTVFMSGLGGWGEDQLQNKIMPYWGKGKNNVLEDLRGLGYECLFPSLGPLNSSWDRVCILWAWLFGGTVDFGKAHAEKYGISRYGRTYEHGALEYLGQPGPHKKANFIGHSMGGPLIKTLSELFVYGSEEERAVTPEDELSPLFKGGHGHLIHCLTTLSGTNNGTALADFPTNYGLSFVTGIFAVLGAVIGDTFMSNVYYIDLPQYGITPEREDAKKLHLRNPLKYTDGIKKVCDPHSGAQNCFIEMTVKENLDVINPSLHPVDKNIYYFAQRASAMQPAKGIHTKPKKGMFALTFIAGCVTGWYAPKALKDRGLDKDPDWFKGDGFVKLKGQSAPTGQPSADAVPGQTEFKPVLWYNMPPVNGDHTSWMDLSFQENRVQNFRDMMAMFRSLPDGETVNN